jgi:hypothetical protein
VSSEYCKLMTEILVNPPPGHVMGHVFLEGTIVTCARDQIAAEMLRHDWDRVLFWDDDMKPTLSQFHKLLSHEEEFVCGGYCKRNIHTKFHIHPLPEAEILPNDLWQMFKAAIGFSVISRSVFERIMAKWPERHYLNVEPGHDPVKLYEFFPWELVGPNTPRGKITRLKEFFAEHKDKPGNHTELLHEAERIVLDDDFSGNALCGEDYAFCHMARESGTKIWLDSQLIVPHVGLCAYPIPHEELIKMTAEEWRQDYWKLRREGKVPLQTGE